MFCVVFGIDLSNALKKIQNEGTKIIPSLVPLADKYLKKGKDNTKIKAPILRNTGIKVAETMKAAVESVLDKQGLQAYRLRQQQRMQKLIADRDAFMAKKADQGTGLQHDNVDPESNGDGNNADASPGPALGLPLPAADGNNDNENDDINIDDSNDDINISTGDFGVRINKLEDEINSIQKKCQEADKSWERARYNGIFDSAYLLMRISGVTVREMHLWQQTDRLKLKYVFWNSLGSFQTEKDMKYWCEYFYSICTDHVFGPLINWLFRYVTPGFNTTNKVKFDETIAKWLTQDADSGVVGLLCMWNEFDLKDFISAIDVFDVKQKKNENNASYSLMRGHDFFDRQNAHDSVLYKTLKNSAMLFHNNWCGIVQFTMKEEYGKLQEFNWESFEKTFGTCTKAIISEECFENYEAGKDEPDYFTLKACRDQLVGYLRGNLSAIPENTPLNYDKSIVNSKDAPQWIKQSSTPMLFGFLAPFFIINHWEYRKHGSDFGLSTPLELLSNSAQGKIFDTCSVLCTYFLKMIKISSYMMIEDKAKDLLTDKDKHIILPMKVKTHLQNMQEKTPSMLDIVKFASAQLDFGILAFYREKFKSRLGPQIKEMVKPTSQFNFFKSKIWGKGAPVAIPAGIEKYDAGVMSMPLSHSVGTISGSQHLILSVTPLKWENYLYLLCPSNIESGFDLMFYDEKGLNMKEPEVTTIDNFVTQCGGYSLMNGDNLNMEYAYAAHYKNIDIFYNHTFGFVKIGRPINEESSKLLKWCKENGTSFERGM